jgi:hypothetical protein
MKTARILMGVTVAVLSPSSRAAAGHLWLPPQTTFVITAQNATGIAQTAGNPTTIAGTISSFKMDRLRGESFQGPVQFEGHMRDHGCNQNDGRCSADSVAHSLAVHGVHVKFYFPDMATEVTSSVIIASDNEVISFSYTTPPLTAQASAALTILVTSYPKEIDEFEKLRLKMNLRLASVNSTILSISSQSLPSADLLYLLSLRERLSRIVNGLTNRIDARTETISELRLPIQVNNLVAGPSRRSAVIGHFRVSIESSIGSAIEGEKTTLRAWVTNLRDAGDEYNDTDDLHTWRVRYLWNGNQIGNSESRTIPHQSTVAFTYATPKLDPKNENVFGVLIEDGAAPGNGPKSSSSHAVRFGHVYLAVPVAPDSIPPAWVGESTPDSSHLFVQEPQPVSAAVVDAFGLLDSTSFDGILDAMQRGDIPATLPILPPSNEQVRAILDTILNEGSPTSVDVTGRLHLVSPDQGQTFVLTGTLGPLPEGLYRIRITASDLAGNFAPELSSTFLVDRTPPTLGDIAPALGFVAPLPSFVVSGTSSEPLREVIVNGLPMSLAANARVYSTSFLASVAGPTSLQVVAYDLAGNVGTATTTVSVPDSVFSGANVVIPGDQALVQIKLGATGDFNSISSLVLGITSASLYNASGAEFPVYSGYVATDLAVLGRDTFATVSHGFAERGVYSGVRIAFGQQNSLVIDGARTSLQIDANDVAVTCPVSVSGGLVAIFPLIIDAVVTKRGHSYVFTPHISCQGGAANFTQTQLAIVRSHVGSRFDRMVASADAIVDALAGSTTAEVGSFRGLPMIYSNVTLTSRAVIKDSLGLDASFSVRTLGGRMNRLIVAPSHMPMFFEGDSSVLFLKRGTSGISVLAGDAGKVPVP